MNLILHNPDNLFPPYRNYSHAVQVKGESNLLFISGLNGYLHNGLDMPEGFEEQPNLSGNIWEQYFNLRV